MKRQDHLLVSRLEHGPAWALLVSLLLGAALFFVQQRMPAPFVVIEEFRSFIVDRRPLPNLRWLDWVVAVHLVFTLSCSLLSKRTVAWRKGDAPRTLYCFRAPPPRFSFWLGGLALVTYLAPFISPLPSNLLATPNHHHEFGFLGALHGAGLMVLLSAVLWCWLTWLVGLRRVRLGEAPSAGPHFFSAGSALFIEQNAGVELVRVFGVRDPALWDPRSFLLEEEDRTPTYRQTSAPAESERDFNHDVPKQPAPADQLYLPFRLDVWLWVCGATALIALLLSLSGHWALAGATAIPGAGLGLAMRDRGTPDPLETSLKRWHWRQEGWPQPAAMMMVGWGLLATLAIQFGGSAYSITPWYEAMALVVPLWLPFWLSFVEPRIFVRLRNGRLEFRRLGLWLPITLAYADSAGVLVLCCGPWRLRLNLTRWGVHGWNAPDLAARMQPYLAYWEPKPDAAPQLSTPSKTG